MFKPTAKMPQNLWRDRPKDASKKKKSMLVSEEDRTSNLASQPSTISRTASVSATVIMSPKPDSKSKKRSLIKAKGKNLKKSESYLSTEVVLKATTENVGENSRGLKKKNGFSIFEMCFPQRRTLRKTKSN